MNIFTIGDSHCYEGWGLIKSTKYCIKPNHLGPKLMYSLKHDNLKPIQLLPNDDDFIVFCLGEIDCRCHIHKFKDNLENVILNMVDNYFNIISDYVKNLITNKICIYLVPPPSNSEIVYNNPEFPFLGSNDERKVYVKKMNETLIKYCNQYNYLYIDLHNKSCDSHGLLDVSYASVDGVHITNPHIFLEWLNNND